MPTLIGRWSLAFSVILFLAGCATTERGSSGKVAEGIAESSRSARLTWEAPTTNTDDSPLTDLAGYNVYYGQVSDHHQMKMIPLLLDDQELSCKKIDCENQDDARTECSYTVQDLSPAPHYFKVTAFNRKGHESDFSNEVKK